MRNWFPYLLAQDNYVKYVLANNYILNKYMLLLFLNIYIDLMIYTQGATAASSRLLSGPVCRTIRPEEIDV